MDLDPSLAFTAILEFYPDMEMNRAWALTAELSAAFGEHEPKDRLAFAQGWLAAKLDGE